MFNRKRWGGSLLLLGLLSGMPGYLSAQVREGFVARYDGPGHGEDDPRVIKLDADGNIYVAGGSVGETTGMDYVTIKYNSSGVEQWVRRYDGPAHGDDMARAMAIDADGNIYVTGESMGVGTDMDYATLKYSPAGDLLWVARYDGPDHQQDYALALAVDNNGHVFVTGASKSLTTDFDYATVAYDAKTGAQLWVRRYDGEEHEYDIPYAIGVDSQNNVYVTGGSEGEGTHLDYVTIKYAPDGTQLWLRRYDGPDHDEDIPWALTIDAWDNIFVTGQSTGLTTNFDITTVKYGPDGEEIWVQRYNDNGQRREDNISRAIAVDDDGYVYVTGSSVDQGLSDYVTIKYNNDGTELWARFYRGPGFGINVATSVVVDGRGNVYITGRSIGNRTGLDYATIKYDANGAMQWFQRYDGPAHAEDAGNGIAIDADGNVYVTGSSVGINTGKDFATIKYVPN